MRFKNPGDARSRCGSPLRCAPTRSHDAKTLAMRCRDAGHSAHPCFLALMQCIAQASLRYPSCIGGRGIAPQVRMLGGAVSDQSAMEGVGIFEANLSLRKVLRTRGEKWPYIARYCDTIAAIPHISRYFLREVSIPPSWCATPHCYLVSHRHICAIPHVAMYCAIVVRYPPPTKQARNYFVILSLQVSCDMKSIATQYWGSKPRGEQLL